MEVKHHNSTTDIHSDPKDIIFGIARFYRDLSPMMSPNDQKATLDILNGRRNSVLTSKFGNQLFFLSI